MKPTVSIICITYNHGKYIKQTLDGFLMQKTDFPFEVLIHDDASTDDTADVIRSYIKNNKNANASFKPIYETKNQYSEGAYEFINNMFKSAQGKYIAYCEGDDYWTDSSKLQKQVDFMEKNQDYALCFHPVRVFFENNEQPEAIHPEERDATYFTIENLLKTNFIQTNSVMYKKQNYNDVVTSVLPGDWYLHLYHARFGKIGFIDEIMSAYRRHAGGVWWDSYSDIGKIWTKHGLAHYSMYCEVKNLFSAVPSLQKFIQPNIYRTLGILIDTDRKYATRLVDQALEDYPHSVDPLTALLSKNVLEYERILEDKVHKIDELNATNARLTEEVKGIKGLKAWKTLRKVQKLKHKILRK